MSGVREERPKPEIDADEGTQKDMPLGTIQLSAEKQQISGVRTGLVERRPLAKVIRTVGLIEADETQIRHIHTKVSGWVEKTYANYTGQLVKEGKPLVAIYSPELVSTQQEYLLALKAKSYLEKSPFGEISSGAHSLLESTRTRLLYWDITPRQIKELEERGEPEKILTLHSPITGFVTLKEVYEGKYVMPDMKLYTVTDLSQVWIYADIYEYEMPLVGCVPGV
jgi:Cu(I)/Ag(I) efflux system membrane fusion protein/cobalt-zinc-cadmium efflux system membrane fusion protein